MTHLAGTRQHCPRPWDETTLSASMGSSPWRTGEVAEVATLSSEIHSTIKQEFNRISEEEEQCTYVEVTGTMTLIRGKAFRGLDPLGLATLEG